MIHSLIFSAAGSFVNSTEDSAEGIKQALTDHKLYQMNDDLRGLRGSLKICEDLGAEPHTIFTDSMEDLLTSVESGMGIAILAKNILEAYGSSHLHSIELDQFVPARVCNLVVWLKSNNNHFVRILAKTAGEAMGECQGECERPCYLSPLKIRRSGKVG